MEISQNYNVVIERDREGYFVGSVPMLPGCHTQAKSLDELVSRIQEAIELYLEVEQEAIEVLDFALPLLTIRVVCSIIFDT